MTSISLFHLIQLMVDRLMMMRASDSSHTWAARKLTIRPNIMDRVSPWQAGMVRAGQERRRKKHDDDIRTTGR